MKKSYFAIGSLLYNYILPEFDFSPSYLFFSPLRFILKGTVFLSPQFDSCSFTSSLGDQPGSIKPPG